MLEGRSEVYQPASDQNDEQCTDIKFFKKNSCKLISVHHNAVKIWTYDQKSKKLKHYNCALG